MTALDTSALTRWQRQPLSFITEILRDPETGKPFVLLDAERAFLEHAYQTDDSGRLVYPEQLYGAPKKSGKTGFAAMHLLTTTLVFGGRFAEGYAIANDLDQAQGRVFLAARRICEASPHLKRECNITQTRIEFPQTGAVIQAIGSDYAGSAGANPVISSFDELWGYVSERSRRLWDEMVPSPVRRISARLVTTYAGFEGESVLLEELHKRGLAQPQVGTDLYVGDGLLMFWSHVPVAPWQTERWLADMRRSLRPNQYLRMIENRFVTTESSFIDMAWWDACVEPGMTPTLMATALPVWVGVDASTKRDSTAIVVVTFNKDAQKVALVLHRIFQPSAKEPLDFEATVEKALRDLVRRFAVRGVFYDPYQMVAVAQRLQQSGIPMRECPQSSGYLTEIGTNLYELIKARGILAYPDLDVRLAISRAIAVETGRGWRIAKEKAAHKIDVVVALAMAAHAAVQRQWDEEVSFHVPFVAGTPRNIPGADAVVVGEVVCPPGPNPWPSTPAAAAAAALPSAPRTWDDTPNGQAWNAWRDAGGHGGPGFDRWSNRNE
jgi:phage terminase large subunit-like protein